ncbi:MAG: hypothetical protein F4Y69_00470 [Chloroflexi bacterium]|nr:hypothetical protein [Chloroflexota bacterium]MXX79488.1 hypothetical protein [Chloroflexota bacterium]MYD15531.1 hypothetical protein [Chloroflexota bacterium]MYJ01204.1 hypothetical protein [Chloroflexota bacterium]
MQFAGIARSARRLIAVGLASLIVLTGWTSISGQDASMYRFFGFAGDVTIDGDPLEPGAVIVASVDGVEVGRAEVNAAGAFVLDVNSDDFDEATCNIVFEVNGLRGRQSGDDCSLRLRLALSSDDAAGAESESEAELAADDDELTQAGAIVRPGTPRTGGGGLAEAESATDWPRTAAITAVLTLFAALAALVLSRRSDGAQ